jgi:three-Cys-motif partner protein
MAKKDRWPELCKLVESDDGLPVRRAGPWTEDKLYYWTRYVDITVGGMKNLWPGKLVYVDLFGGPGVCLNEHTGKRFPGSPVVAASAEVPFRRIISVELDSERARACEARVRRFSAAQDLRVIRGDCNAVIEEVVASIPANSLTLAFVDPESLQLRFETLRKLASVGRLDLLILFPVGYDIVRNIRLYELQDQSKLDAVLGSGWRADWENVANRESAKVIKFFTDEYRNRLQTELGYEHVDDVSIKWQGKVFYKLVYASGDERGIDFWRKALKKERGGQMGFGF